MAGQRRRSASKTPATTTPTVTTASTPNPKAPNPPPQTSKLKIHGLLENYEVTVSALISSLAEDPFKPESTTEITQRLLQYEKELDEALEEGYPVGNRLITVKLHYENTIKIQQLQKQNADLSRLFSTSLSSLSEARSSLASLPDSKPATIDSKILKVEAERLDKIPYQLILEYASKISKYTSPPPQWDSSRPQLPGMLSVYILIYLGSFLPWPSEDGMRRGRLAQLAVDGLPELAPETQEMTEEQKPRRNPGRRASNAEVRRRKMSEAGEPKPIHLREKEREVEFELDLFNPEEE
jgi:hypothetical protein